MEDELVKLAESSEVKSVVLLPFTELPSFDEETSVVLEEYSLRYKEALRRGEAYRKNSRDKFKYQ